MEESLVGSVRDWTSQLHLQPCRSCLASRTQPQFVKGRARSYHSFEMKIYLAGAVFTQVERLWNRRFAELLTQQIPELEVILPQDFRTGDSYNDHRHFGRIFELCRSSIQCADAVVAVLDGADSDSGVAWEVGYAHGIGKPIVGIRTDYRHHQDKGLNIMLYRSLTGYVFEPAFSEDPIALAKAVAQRLRRLAGSPQK